MTRMAQVFRSSTVASVSLTLTLSLLLGACGEKPKYKAEPTYTGAKASVPKVPQLPSVSTFKDGSAWTIYGLQHQLNNPRHRAEVDGKPAVVTGYVVDVYRPVEPPGKQGCVYPPKKSPPTSKDPTPKGVNCDLKGIEPPHFYIADNKDEKNRAKMITVMGYASTFIQQYQARDWYKNAAHKIDSTKEDDLYMDNNYSSHITILGEPKVGSKVTITGQFAAKYEEGQGGRRVEPLGIIDVTSHKKGKIECTDCIEPIELR
ncbi:MAG: hypothetical protein NVS3B20_16820 [Polyangiales bacterium]